MKKSTAKAAGSTRSTRSRNYWMDDFEKKTTFEDQSSAMANGFRGYRADLVNGRPSLVAGDESFINLIQGYYQNGSGEEAQPRLPQGYKMVRNSVSITVEVEGDQFILLKDLASYGHCRRVKTVIFRAKENGSWFQPEGKGLQTD